MKRRNASTLRKDLNLLCGEGAAYGWMVGLGETYLPAFVLAVGLGEVTSGLIATVPLLAGAALQLVSPRAVSLLRSHRRWVVLCAVAQALSFVPLVAGAVRGDLSTGAAYLVATMYWAAGLATGPAWNTWAGRIVPGRLRPRFFARRSRLMQVTTLAGFLAGGALLAAGPSGMRIHHRFAVLFLVAAAARTVSSSLLLLQSEPALEEDDFRSVPVPEIVRRAFAEHDGRLLLYLLSVQVAVQIAGPFFTPFMLGKLRFSYLTYVLVLAVAYLGKIAALPFLGDLARRRGTHWLLWIGGVGIVPLPALWALSGSVPYLLGIQVLSGATWAAYELATVLLFFDDLREEERTSLLTAYNLGNAIAMVGGSLLGGAFLSAAGETRGGYLLLFLLSSGIRCLTLPFLWKLTKPRLAREVPSLRPIAVRPAVGAVLRPVVAALTRRRRLTAAPRVDLTVRAAVAHEGDTSRGRE